MKKRAAEQNVRVENDSIAAAVKSAKKICKCHCVRDGETLL